MEFTPTYCKVTYYIVYIEKVLNTCEYALTSTSVMIRLCSEHFLPHRPLSPPVYTLPALPCIILREDEYT